MASLPQPGSSTHGKATRAPPPPASVNAPAHRAYMQKCPVLLDWWLEREKGEGGKIRVAGYTTRNRAARVFTSDSITMRHADGTLETADGVTVLIRGPLNIARMHQNGFPYEVKKSPDIQDKAKGSSTCMSSLSVEPRRIRSAHVRQVGSSHQKDALNGGSSVARIVAADKLQSQDSRHKGRGRTRKRVRRCY